MTLPKFIITMDGYFRLGMVNQHKHLLKPGDQCIGGGSLTLFPTASSLTGNHTTLAVPNGICWKH